MKAKRPRTEDLEALQGGAISTDIGSKEAELSAEGGDKKTLQ